MEKSYLKKLAGSGFSIIPVSETKAPIGAWKKYQTEARTKEEIDSLTSPLFGIVTGFNNLEVLDFDLKIFSTLQEQNDFWQEFLLFAKDNIDEFDEKFVIVKTKNAGYHILYRCNTIQGNTKIAVPKGRKEALIESRGIGGMVVIYEKFITENQYYNVQEISEQDREILWSICKIYHYVEEELIIIEPKQVKEYSEAELKPWVDYNDKVSIFDIVGEDFKMLRNLNDKYVIKRHGGTSIHSGFVYKNSGCMYLFSTGTIYPHEKLITPFIAYTYKFHNGDFKEAGAEIYRKGFGSRVVKKEYETKLKPVVNKSDLVFPIDVFPKSIQAYILECNDTLDSSVDYMGCSMLWLISVVIGNSIQIEVKRGWQEIATVWIAVVGKAGLGKTPSISNIIFPLLKANSKEIKNYIKQAEKFEHYSALDKKEKQNHEEIHRPVKTQFIANDITLEALVDLHQESKISIGVFKDELNGWFKDMNKYRAGSDLEFWLSTWSGKSVSLNRKTAKSSFVDKPLIPVLGGIQPSILNTFYTEENKDNGFVDRMLLSFPELEIDSYNVKEMEYETIKWYSDVMISFYETMKQKVVQYDSEQDIEPLVAVFSLEAKKEWQRIFNEITNVQNSDEENEYMKSMLPKQKSYIPRFALLIHVFDDFFSENTKSNALEVSKDSILKAEKLSKYFVAMAKKIKVNSIEHSEMKSIVSVNKMKSTKEQFEEMYKKNPDLKKSEAGDILGVSRRQIYHYIKEIECEASVK